MKRGGSDMAEWIMQESKDEDGVDSLVKKAELVRCGSCVHWDDSLSNKVALAYCKFHRCYAYPTDFCGWAIKR